MTANHNTLPQSDTPSHTQTQTQRTVVAVVAAVAAVVVAAVLVAVVVGWRQWPREVAVITRRGHRPSHSTASAASTTITTA